MSSSLMTAPARPPRSRAHSPGRWALVGAAASFLCAALAFPTVALTAPMQVSQQGRVLDSVGDGLDGVYTIEFTFYSDDTGTTAVWSEELDVDVDAGYYSAILGQDVSGNPLDDSVFDSYPIYLGLSVDGGPTMSPLLEVTRAPYAIQAETATNVNGGTVDATELRIAGDEIIDSSGNWVGPTPDDSLTDLLCSDGDTLVWNNSTGSWACGNFAFVQALDLGVGSSVDGELIATGPHYADADAIAAMGDLVDTNPLHHDRYSDADAMAAMGANDDTNPYNHDRYSDADAVAAVGVGELSVDTLIVGDYAATEDKYVRVNTGQDNVARLEAYGPTGGAGKLFIGQNYNAGGGMVVAGSGHSGEGELFPNYVSFYRRNGGTDYPVFGYHYASNNVTFEGRVYSERPAFSATAFDEGLVRYYVTVPFTERTDNANMFDATTSEMVAPRDGLYFVTVRIDYQNGPGAGSSDAMYLSWYVNDTYMNPKRRIKAETGKGMTTSTSGFSLSMSDVLSLQAGDRVKVHNSGLVYTNDLEFARRSFSGFYLGD